MRFRLSSAGHPMIGVPRAAVEPIRSARLLALAGAALCAAPVASAFAQSAPAPSAPTSAAPARVDSMVAVAGTVRGPDGIGLAGAEVTLTPKPVPGLITMARRIFTDDSGSFRVPSMPVGVTAVAVRRIGFKPVLLEATLPSETPLFILLDPGVQTLSKVVVRDRQRDYTGPLADFNRRRDMGMGKFITRAEIDRRNAMRTTDMLRMIPGIAVYQGPGGSSMSIRNSRCQPLVWIDGTPALSGPLDVDIFAPFTLDGIEVYKGPSEVPVELRGPRGEERCGVIALWSRMPERQPKKSKRKPVTAEELNALIASATVYTADQVDRPARADSSVMIEPVYPDSLRAARTAGMAVVEFVVDAEGRVETETISVVLASHPAFGRAARDAAPSARFIPALLRGQAVRQVVQIPVEFQATMRGRNTTARNP